MNEYTFLLKGSWRSAHVKAKTLREAFRKTLWEQHLFPSQFVGMYQWCHAEGIGTMSGWLDIRDKTIIKRIRKGFVKED